MPYFRVSGVFYSPNDHPSYWENENVLMVECMPPDYEKKLVKAIEGEEKDLARRLIAMAREVWPNDYELTRYETLANFMFGEP